MKSPLIKTDNYIIRPFRDSDTELWQVWDIDEEVQAHMPEPVNEKQAVAEQLEYIKICEAEEDGYYWSIETKEGVTIGTIALTDINDYHKLAELGVVVGDKNYWGKGVATEVVKAVVTYAFDQLDLERISAEAETDNAGIRKVLLTTGFTEDGLFKSARVKNGERVDVRHFAILKSYTH